MKIKPINMDDLGYLVGVLLKESFDRPLELTVSPDRNARIQTYGSQHSKKINL